MDNLQTRNHKRGKRKAAQNRLGESGCSVFSIVRRDIRGDSLPVFFDGKDFKIIKKFIISSFALIPNLGFLSYRDGGAVVGEGFADILCGDYLGIYENTTRHRAGDNSSYHDESCIFRISHFLLTYIIIRRLLLRVYFKRQLIFAEYNQTFFHIKE